MLRNGAGSDTAPDGQQLRPWLSDRLDGAISTLEANRRAPVRCIRTAIRLRDLVPCIQASARNVMSVSGGTACRSRLSGDRIARNHGRGRLPDHLGASDRQTEVGEPPHRDLARVVGVRLEQEAGTARGGSSGREHTRQFAVPLHQVDQVQHILLVERAVEIDP